MSPLRVGLILALIGSLILGVFAGWIFHRLFLAHVPEQCLSGFQASATPITFVGTGLVFGLAICIWALFVAWLAPGFRRPKS